MRVHKVIVHELYKPKGSSGAKLSKSLNLMDHTHLDVINMVTELNNRYRKRSEKQGIFDSENPTIFHQSFEIFFSDTTKEDTFISFSHDSAENLKDKIEGIGAAKGGYLIYAHYEDYRHYCSVFFVRDTTSIAFKRNKSVQSFDLNKVQHIDFEKLAMACRINMQAFIEENSKYLSFIHTKSDDMSQYFVRWISTRDTVTSEEDTKHLLKALKKMPLPTTEGVISPTSRDEIIKGAHSLIKASPTKTINLREMGKTLFDNEDYIANYIHENYPSVPNEFKAHPTAMRNFVRVYAKADEVELNFYPNAYRMGIVKFDEADNTQLIIKSKNIVEQVRESLHNE
jgi:nucleoid-associated protein YejK